MGRFGVHSNLMSEERECMDYMAKHPSVYKRLMTEMYVE